LIFPDTGQAADTVTEAQLPVILTVTISCALPHTTDTLHRELYRTYTVFHLNHNAVITEEKRQLVRSATQVFKQF
jgi:hypothetical protein